MSELHEVHLTPVSAPAHQPKPTRREQRRRRRTRRHRFEEILGWIVVPFIVYGIYWGIGAGFEVLGTTPGTVWDQLMQVKQMMEKRT